jgi:hypothetical protein
MVMREESSDVCAHANTAIMSYDVETATGKQTASRRVGARAKDVQVVTRRNTSGLRWGGIPGVLEELLESASNILLLFVFGRLAVF